MYQHQNSKYKMNYRDKVYQMIKIFNRKKQIIYKELMLNNQKKDIINYLK